MRDESILWYCTRCEDMFRSVPDRHRVDHCQCGDSWVDHEQDYLRRAPTAKQHERLMELLDGIEQGVQNVLGGDTATKEELKDALKEYNEE